MRSSGFQLTCLTMDDTCPSNHAQNSRQSLTLTSHLKIDHTRRRIAAVSIPIPKRQHTTESLGIRDHVVASLSEKDTVPTANVLVVQLGRRVRRRGGEEAQIAVEGPGVRAGRWLAVGGPGRGRPDGNLRRGEGGVGLGGRVGSAGT